ncbi:MAG: PaaI family thioesterase, partial [Antricoccus sp.]
DDPKRRISLGRYYRLADAEYLTMQPKSPGEFAESVGIEMDTVSGDEVTAHVEILPKLHQPYGIAHGGVYCSIVETLASVGAATWWGERGRVVGVSNSTDFFRSTREGIIQCRATPLHRGRSTQVWVVEMKDEQDRLISRGQVRLQNLT